jgi:hypothetical protein
MARVTELRIRPDWGFVKFAYLPALAVGIAASKWLLPALAVSVRVAPCGICVCLRRWANHMEEWYNRKPLLQISETGLRYEDGDEPVEFFWGDVVGVVMHRRNWIPPWRTNGSTEITPPYWLTIAVRDEPQSIGADEGYIDRRRYLPPHGSLAGAQLTRRGADEEKQGSSEGYVDRRSYSAVTTISSEAATEQNLRIICIWPRQVVGGLFSLMRFAKELQRYLIEAADRGEIPSLLPTQRPVGSPARHLTR